MGVYIKGMKMPKNCCECEIRSYDANAGEEYCPFSQMECLSIGIQDNCPLVEVPEKHGRLFDEAEVKKVLHGLPNSKDKWGAIALLEWAVEKRWCIEAEGNE